MTASTLLHILIFLIGLAIVVRTIFSAIQTFVLPRSANDAITRAVFLSIRKIFDLRTNRARTYEDRDRAMALYAPIGLLSLPPVWLILVLIGFMGMFWAIGVPTPAQAFSVSGSSLLTLGFATLDNIPQKILAFSEASIGLILVALLISYLPTMYSAFSRRELAVTMLEVRAGSPPSAVAMIERLHRNNALGQQTEFWEKWEMWFADIEETHTSLAALVFFRSPQPRHSWITAAGVVLDAASLTLSTIDVPPDPRAAFCIRAGYLALREITGFFGARFSNTPDPDDPISLSRQEYDAVYEQLASKAVPLKSDREQAWRDFKGWRVNYDHALLTLANLTMAPYATWVSDRSPRRLPRLQK